LGIEVLQPAKEELMGKVGSERRRYPRSHRDVPLVVDESGPGVLNHVDNISATGVLCHTIKPVPLMTRLRIVLDLPKPFDRRVDAEGIVVRCEPDEKGDDHFRVAIIYSKLDDEDHQAIQEFVESDLPL
jgi:hypothetical protein